jgi:hypothetical protein
MSREHGLIESFLAQVRSRLNRHRLWTTLVWVLAAAAAGLVVVGLWYALSGDAVPGAAIGWTLALAAAGCCVAAVLRRYSVEGAAQFADRLFRLHDSITSYLHFSRDGRRDGYYTLQAEQTRARVAELDANQIKYQPPRRGIAVAACLLAIAVPLSLRGPSEAVLRERRLAAETQLATEKINDQLAKAVEQLREEAPADEKELLNPNKLREWVKALKESSDQKEALRQYAELERKLNDARLAVQNKRDEQLLERAARELETTQETQPLAEPLAEKNYDKAAEQLEKMAPTASEQPLSKQRQDLARLKAVAQHMAAAARAVQESAASAKSPASASASSSESASSKAASNGATGSVTGADGSGGGGEMSQTMQDLDQKVADLDKSLKDAEHEQSQHGQCDAKTLGECQSCSKCVSDQINKLCSSLKKLGMCQRTDQRLCKLCQCCSQCQSGLCMCQGLKPGGSKAGTGTDPSRRNETDPLTDNGQTTALKGIKGTGPSLTTIESTAEGSGTSARRATEHNRTFARQYESFIAREDVPDEVKDGVKHYFENIHQLTPESTSAEIPAHDGNSN